MATHAKPSEATRRVSVGSVPLGGGAPVVVQSMLNAPATDVAANLVQIDALAQAGCEIVRMAIPHRSSLDVFQAVCERSPLPVVADIHFDARIAVEAAKRGAAKLRINPGNIGGLAKTDAVLRMKPARKSSLWLAISASAGSSLSVGAYSWLMRMIFTFVIAFLSPPSKRPRWRSPPPCGRRFPSRTPRPNRPRTLRRCRRRRLRPGRSPRSP